MVNPFLVVRIGSVVVQPHNDNRKKRGGKKIWAMIGVMVFARKFKA
jgi:hypothetical protein